MYMCWACNTRGAHPFPHMVHLHQVHGLPYWQCVLGYWIRALRSFAAGLRSSRKWMSAAMAAARKARCWRCWRGCSSWKTLAPCTACCLPACGSCRRGCSRFSRMRLSGRHALHSPHISWRACKTLLFVSEGRTYSKCLRVLPLCMLHLLCHDPASQADMLAGKGGGKRSSHLCRFSS